MEVAVEMWVPKRVQSPQHPKLLAAVIMVVDKAVGVALGVVSGVGVDGASLCLTSLMHPFQQPLQCQLHHHRHRHRHSRSHSHSHSHSHLSWAQRSTVAWMVYWQMPWGPPRRPRRPISRHHLLYPPLRPPHGPLLPNLQT